MNKSGFIGKDTFMALGMTATPIRPKVLNLNQGADGSSWLCARRGVSAF